MFRNRYGEIRGGWAVLISLLIVAAGSAAVSLLTAAIFYQILGDSSTAMDLLPKLGSEAAMFLLSAALFKIAYRRPLKQTGLAREEGLKFFLLGFLFGALCATAVILALMVVGNLRIVEVNTDFYRHSGFFLALALFFAGFGEEMLCRGVFCFQLRTTRKKWAIILLSGVFFTLLHVFDSGVTVLALLNLGLSGVLFAVLLIRSGSLWLSVGAHGAWNLVQGGLFGAHVNGQSTFGILNTSLGGSSLLTGGEFGVEGGLAATAVLVLAIGAAILLFRRPIADGWALNDLPVKRLRAPAYQA